MARPRKPLAEQRGHLTVYSQQRRRMEEEQVRQDTKLPERPPAHLDVEAKKEWRRIIPALNNMDSIGDLDRAYVEGYCVAYSEHVQLTKRLRDFRRDAKKQGIDIDLEVEADLMKKQKQAATEMRAFMAKCGLDVSSRLKLAAEKVDKVEKDINVKFGAI